MTHYRKSDEHYFDEYDRETIRILKKLELELMPEDVNDGIQTTGLIIEGPRYNPLSQFYMRGVQRAQDRQQSVKGRMFEDEQRDRLTRQHSQPRSPTCRTCGARMNFCLHLFDVPSIPILFAYECPDHHSPRRFLYADGKEYRWPEKRCDFCGRLIVSTKEPKERTLVMRDRCSGCDREDIVELGIASTPKEFSTEEEKKKYCVYFEGRTSVIEDLEKIGLLAKHLETQKEEKRVRETYGVDKVERITIPVLEENLVKLSKDHGFIKFQFDKPETKRFFAVPFSVQDPTSRTSQESIKAFSKALRNFLFCTNWRLIDPTYGISYRLGYLTGRLRAAETDEDLLKIAKEIYERSNPKKS